MPTNFQRRLWQHWQQSTLGLSVLLLPLSIIFYLMVWLRRVLYKTDCLRVYKLPVPVVIVGNINMGGVGKTPIVIKLVEVLKAKGIAVGVISRGYGRKAQNALMVDTLGSIDDFGDEPFLIAKRLHIPVAVAAKRVNAGRLLLKKHPKIQVILADDGLQHYQLARDIEIVVVDAKQGFGNGCILPQGPLREPISRLREAQAIVLTHSSKDDRAPEQLSLPKAVPLFLSHLDCSMFYSLNHPQQTRFVADFMNQEILALAGIGQPEQFFETLRALGIKINETLCFSDHHQFNKDDIPSGFDAVLVTEKDAVKLQQFALNNVWVLPVNATIFPDLANWLIAQLKL